MPAKTQATAYTRFCVETTNQPESRGSFTLDLTSEKLSEVLGWNPDGILFRRFLASLKSGKAVVAYSSSRHKHPSTKGVEFLLTPLAEEPVDGEPLTDDMIRDLRREAGVAGGTVQVAACARALEGDGDARDACAQAITAARAMDDDVPFILAAVSARAGVL